MPKDSVPERTKIQAFNEIYKVNVCTRYDVCPVPSTGSNNCIVLMSLIVIILHFSFCVCFLVIY